MTQHERFVREVLWPMLMGSKEGMTRQDIENHVPGIHCSGFISHLIKKNGNLKPILEEIGERDGRSVLHLTRHWKKQLSTVDEAVKAVADRIHKVNNDYYDSKEAKLNRKKLAKKKKRDQEKITRPADDLAAVISGKPTQEKINAMKAEVLDFMLKGPGVREAMLTKLKVKAFTWER